MKYKGIKAAATATNKDTSRVTDVAIMLKDGVITTRTVSKGNWIADADCDAIIYAKSKMTMASIEMELDRALARKTPNF